MKLNDAIEHATNGFNHFECPDAWPDCQAARAITLCLLDPTPVTGEALVAMGWTEIKPHGTTWVAYESPRSHRTGPIIHLTYQPLLGCDGWDVNGETVANLETLGQVRCACLAFGIPIREEA